MRLCRQAYDQGGLLSNCDLAELLASQDERISQLVCEYERQHRIVVPRRATVHNVGSGMTHKRIICYKRYAEGKPAELLARETYHILDCSLRLVKQYLAIDDELEAARG